MNFLFQLLGDMTSSLIRSIRAIEDGYLVVFSIYETYQIFETHLSTHLSNLIALSILIIKKIALGLNTVVFNRTKSTYHVFSSVVAYIEYLGIEAQPVEKTVDFLTDVRFASSRYQISILLHPTIPTITFYGLALQICCIFN